MRLVAVVTCAWVAVGCAAGDRPYRFTQPMLGVASVPPRPLPGARPAPETAIAAASLHDPGLPRPIRTATAPTIREASARAAAQVTAAAAARPAARAALADPHRATATPPRTPTTAEELRSLVGHRDKADASGIALGWARALGATTEGRSGAELVAWATTHDRLDPSSIAIGDLLVFDHVVSDAPADLVAVVIGRDERGVVEMMYVGGGVVRRGFLDAARPRLRRDDGDRVVNTYLRHVRRWPAKGTRYLAGELLAHVVRAR